MGVRRHEKDLGYVFSPRSIEMGVRGLGFAYKKGYYAVRDEVRSFDHPTRDIRGCECIIIQCFDFTRTFFVSCQLFYYFVLLNCLAAVLFVSSPCYSLVLVFVCLLQS